MDMDPMEEVAELEGLEAWEEGSVPICCALP
jgi:hypothetical protein